MIPKAIPLRSIELFELAVRHRSAVTSVIDSYERLEFFGDSVLGLVIAQYLFDHHPDWDQGMLSKAKSSIVQEAPLAQAALRLGLDQFICVSANEEITGGRTRPSILADVLEALIGAIYLESGLEAARWFVLEQLHEPILRIRGGDVNPDDFKSKLQEASQSIWRKAPQYRIVRESGGAHERRFVAQVCLDNEVLGEGEGRSKKEAEQAAAADALLIIERHQQRQGRRETEVDEP
jgi:ribonuclease-3